MNRKAKMSLGLAALLIPAFLLAGRYRNARGLPSDFRDAVGSEEGAFGELKKAVPGGTELNLEIPSPEAVEPAVAKTSEEGVAARVVATAPGCYAPLSSGVQITDAIRSECVRKSRILFDSQPSINSAEDIRKGNVGQAKGFDMEETIHCSFTPPPPYVWQNSGKSEKFSCYRTDGGQANDGAGSYYNSKGETVPEAVSVGAYGTQTWGSLLDGAGQVLGKADRLKVKYYLGSKRMTECFSETASSRLFWALGIPTDDSFAVRQIVCHGCQANPFKNQQMKPASGAQTFEWTSIERSFEGETVESQPDQHGWDWPDLKAAAASSGRLDHYESLLLAGRLVSMSRPKALQNKIICARPDARTGLCGEVYSIIHDLGSTFGSASLLQRFPRADIKAYASRGTFKDKASCMLTGDYGHERVSESSRRFFAARLLSAFGDPARPGTIDKERVEMLFRVAHFEGIQGSQEKGGIDAWTELLTGRMNEVLTARCGSGN